MKIIIIEDEQPAFKRLTKLVKAYDAEIEILGHADSIATAITLIKEFPHADLALMDIELADGQSFEIFKQIEVPFPIIFTTAYDEYALKAFKVNSIDYLLKPIEPEELKQAFAKLEKLQQPQNGINIHQLLSSFKQKDAVVYKQRFLVKLGQKLISVPISEIAFFNASDKVVYLYNNENKRFIIDSTLDELEGMLDPLQFYRINRQYLANLNAIDTISTYFNGKLKLHLKPSVEEEVLVSRERATEFKNWLNQ
jgi:DNA-binding LytR/AlgR family response regulator